MDYMSWLWLGGIVLFAIVEGVTAGLVSIWFVPGCLAALFCAMMGFSVLMQTIVFAIVSALTLVATRPLMKKMKIKVTATNADRVLGMQGKVTETIDNNNTTGSVYIDGKTWTARSADGVSIPMNSIVSIASMEGVTLFVKVVS